MDRPLSSEDLAERYGTTVATIRGWRYKRKGPKFFRAGKRVYYRPADVDAWEKDQAQTANA